MILTKTGRSKQKYFFQSQSKFSRQIFIFHNQKVLIFILTNGLNTYINSSEYFKQIKKFCVQDFFWGNKCENIFVVCLLQTFIVAGNKISLEIVPNICFQNAQPPAHVSMKSHCISLLKHHLLKRKMKRLFPFKIEVGNIIYSATCHLIKVDKFLTSIFQ